MVEKNIPTFNPGSTSGAQQLEKFTDVRELQRQLKKRGVSMRSEAGGSSTGPASVQLDEPHLVIAVIRDVAATARK
jgi:hypothetical protein